MNIVDLGTHIQYKKSMGSGCDDVNLCCQCASYKTFQSGLSELLGKKICLYIYVPYMHVYMCDLNIPPKMLCKP